MDATTLNARGHVNRKHIPKISPRECEMCKKIEYIDPAGKNIHQVCSKCSRKSKKKMPFALN